MKEIIESLSKNGMIEFFIASLISADSLHTLEDYEKSMKIVKEMQNVLPFAKIDEQERTTIAKFLNESEKILRDESNRLKAN